MAGYYHDGDNDGAFGRLSTSGATATSAPQLYYTYRFSNDEAESVEVEFFDSLPEGIVWDTGYTPVTSNSLQVDVIYTNGDRDAAVPSLLMPPGTSTLVLRTNPTVSTGTIDNDATITPTVPGLDPISANASIDLDSGGSGSGLPPDPSSGGGGSLWMLANRSGTQNVATLVRVDGYASESGRQVHDYGEIFFQDGSIVSSFATPHEMEALAVGSNGIAYIVENKSMSVDGQSYARPLFRIDTGALAPGGPVMAEFVGDLAPALNAIDTAKSVISNDDEISGLAIAPDGGLYATFRNAGFDYLIVINPFNVDANKVLTGVRSIGAIEGNGTIGEDVEDLAFGSGGTLYVSDTKQKRIFSVDPATAAILGEFSPASNSSNYAGLAFDPSGNVLIASDIQSFPGHIVQVAAGDPNDVTVYQNQALDGYGWVKAITFPASAAVAEPATVVLAEDFEGASPGIWSNGFSYWGSNQDFSNSDHGQIADGGGRYAALYSEPTQASVDLPGLLTASQLAAVAGGSGVWNFSAWLASWKSDASISNLSVEWFDGLAETGTSLGTAVLADGSSATGVAAVVNGTVLENDATNWNVDNWSRYVTSGAVPAGAQSFVMTYSVNPGGEGYADKLSFSISE